MRKEETKDRNKEMDRLQYEEIRLDLRKEKIEICPPKSSNYQ